MTDKGWKYVFHIRRYPRTFIFGCRLEAYRLIPSWPSIAFILHFWHKSYRFWLYKMGEDTPSTKPSKPSWWHKALCVVIVCGLQVLLWALDLFT